MVVGRLRIFFLLSLMLGCNQIMVTPVASKPQRIVGLDTATDTLILRIADLENVVAVRERTQVQENSTQWEKASRLIGLHREMAEEVYRLKPDIVFFGKWSGRQTREMLKSLGVNVVRLNSVNTWDDVRLNIREVGRLLEEPERADALVDEIDTRLRAVESKVAGKTPLRGICYLGRGSTYGAGSKLDFVMKSAGISNIAAELGIKGLGKLSLEELLLSKPDVVVFTSYHKDTPSLSRELLNHPAFQGIEYEVKLLEVESAKLNAMDTDLVDCVELLARQAHPEAFAEAEIVAHNE